MINITINNQELQVEEGTTIIQAAKILGITIPTLCFLKLCSSEYENKPLSCRVCLVEVEGNRNLIPSCATECQEGMVIKTNTKRALDGRRAMIELILSNHPYECLFCERDKHCELQSVAASAGIQKIRFEGEKSLKEIDSTGISIKRDPNKCIMCRRCETVCNKVQGIGIYSGINRGFNSFVGTAENITLSDTHCTYCGQCVNVCPTGALVEKNDTDKLIDYLNDETKTVIVQTAPAVRVALGEEFGYPVGTRVTGKMVSALRSVGFHKVFDTSFGADITIMEQANELLTRIKNDGPFPMLTSGCPAWIKFAEHNYHDQLHLISSSKSPHQMFGNIIKTYYAEKKGLEKKDIVVVSVMPCVSKKFEASRPELEEEVDLVITTRELARLIRANGLNFNELPDGEFDKILGESSGAGVIFGTVGGAIEASTRTAVSWLSGENIFKIDFESVNGHEGISEAKINVNGLELKIGVANGLSNARTLMEKVKNGETDYHAIEIMACPGGCINGGGQPYHSLNKENLIKRAAGLHAENANKQIRLAHENIEIKNLCENYLGKPGSDKACNLLHTEFYPRGKFQNDILTENQ